MKPKQLAYVLIKVFGLSLFVTGILGIAGGLLNLFQFRSGGGITPVGALMMPAHGIISMVIGFFLIVRSRHLADYLFKDDDE
jgi:hypothetical protein